MGIGVAIISLGLLALVSGLILGYAAIRFKVKSDPIVEQIDAILPQTQCGQCGYPGCKPYANAIANGDEINKCPPGGEAVILKLADLMGVEPTKLEGEEKPKAVAFVHEDECIGCTKCIQACPVDAILGATRQMHTVITDECTGCELCVAPCPTDCIEMIPVGETTKTWQWDLNSISIKEVQ
ncbi:MULTISPECIES: electron transport complex subunit RsxB [unclassified Motilimonas]|uniref:electron transport complex subunit RsxB n=1 Tax=Motilimonas TaxID=1914248 RepID=UPI001E3083E0|nr:MULTISPECIES: electron transport complex subunit RsxB [unclassified Motilimonas]MCE0555554.1 electron transport complex subunit RsxB [Motilimonas sp. E26]MDO6528187.1 electron transport complex subunit RsxB [Motilimonas sp. 1_MG-2023]